MAAVKALRAMALISTGLLIAGRSGLDSCSIAPNEPVFATSQRPADLDQFLKGRLGILQRSYRQNYLIGAFRILSGLPLTKGEIQSLYGPPSGGLGSPYAKPNLDGWIATRATLRGLGAGLTLNAYTYKTVSISGLVYSFPNCHEDAFLKATETFQDLAMRWGKQDPRVLDWVRAQDRVFANCSGTDPVMPESPDAGMDPLLAAHRRYQVAAAYFYSGQFRKASGAFDQIAKEKDSPWQPIAAYLVARSLLRAGMFDGDREAYREGKDRLLAILNDPKQSRWHGASLGLLHLWQLRVEPRARLVELGAELMRPNENDIGQSAIDFLYLVNARKDSTGREWSLNELQEVEASNELAAWLFSMSIAPPADAGQRSVEWWRERRNPAWLIAALANAPEKDLPELLRAARQISPKSAGYESVAYYAMSRQANRGRMEDARRWADRALRQDLLLSSRNRILALRTRMARDWTEFLRFSLRRPEPNIALLEGSLEGDEKTPMPTGTARVFDGDVTDLFNAHLPLSLWVDASGDALLPTYMQLRIAQAGWLRAMLLGKAEEAGKLMRRIMLLQPGAAELAQGFLSAHDPEEARFAALFIILRIPSLSPWLWSSEYRTPNFAAPHYLGSGCWYNDNAPPPRQPSSPSLRFLTSDQRMAAETEWKQIHAAESWGATLLARQTVDWARKHPDDPRVPEALHRAVQASRYRCTDANTGKYSKQAFDLLHRQYSKSKWMDRTKYWYK